MSYSITKQKSQYCKDLVQQMLSYNIQTQQGLQNLIKFVTNLPPTIESSKVIKKLLIRCGLAIMIYLKPCYDKLNIQQEEQIQKFKQLAGIGKQMICNKQIKEIEFLFKFGVIPYKKQVKKYANQMYFINIVEQISKLNEKFACVTLGDDQTFQHYNQKFNQLKKNYYLMIQNQNDINQETPILIKKSFNQFRLPQNKFYLKQTKDQKTSSWGDSANESEQQMFGDYYDHQNTAKTFSGYLSFSMLSTQNNSFLVQSSRNLCCRKFFFKDQCLNYEQNQRTTFLQIRFPFSEIALQEIKRAICSMLNCQGGKIYIGISKKSGKKKIQTIQYTQNDKQQIYKQFRRAAQKIEPKIMTQKLYSVQFIPICDQNKEFIPGANIIRISVTYGIRDQIYSYEKDGFDYFPFRNDIEIIQKQGRQLLKAHRSIILKPLSIPVPFHPHPCEKPQIGEPLHQRYSSGMTVKKQKRYEAKTNLSQMNIATTLSKQDINNNHIYSMQVQGKKKSVPIKRGQNDPNQSQHVKKQHTNHAYFYVVGLDEKHLTPIFIEKGIIQNIKIQSTKDHKLVIRIHGTSQTQKARKILKKIGQKYEKKNIKVYEMSIILEIQKKNYDQGIKLIKNLKLPYKLYSDNRVKFKLFRESLHSFIELQSNKISVKFFIQNQQVKQMTY